jgi:hypothetical protein
MPRTKLPKGSVPVTVRLPREVQRLLFNKALREKMSFSELVLRALRRELRIARPSKPRNSATNRGRQE